MTAWPPRITYHSTWNRFLTVNLIEGYSQEAIVSGYQAPVALTFRHRYKSPNCPDFDRHRHLHCREKDPVAKAKNILVLNGPNLNMLGIRQPEVYGRDTLQDIAKACVAKGKALGLGVDFRQSNIEGELVTWIQQARGRDAGIVFNPAAYGHTSIALLDALTLAELPVIEVHLSNIHRREPFRHSTYISQIATGVICGLGAQGYLLALEAMANLVTPKKAR